MKKNTVHCILIIILAIAICFAGCQSSYHCRPEHYVGYGDGR